MKRVVTILPLLVLVAETAAAQERRQESQAGSLCLAPVQDDGDPRGYVSKEFSVRIGNGPWVAVPSEAPKLIPDLALKDRHLVSIRDGDETIESFWFRFDKFDTRDLCLWYKPWYRTWSLWDASHGGRKCRCRTAEGERAG